MAPKQNQLRQDDPSTASDNRSVRETVKAVLAAPFDQTFFDWMSHGSTEVANMLLHGHAAPVYSRSSMPAPAESEAPAQLDPAMSTAATQDAPSTANGAASVVDKHLPQTHSPAEIQAEQPLVTSHGPIDGMSTSVVDQHLPNPAQCAPSPEREHELSR